MPFAVDVDVSVCACVNVSACDARVAVFAITYDIYMLNGQTGAASRCTCSLCENDRAAKGK